jgi:hypothetical protein
MKKYVYSFTVLFSNLCKKIKNVFKKDCQFNRIIDDQKTFIDLSLFVAANFNSLDLLKKIKDEYFEICSTSKVKIGDKTEDLIITSILGNGSDEDKYNFLKCLHEDFGIKFDGTLEISKEDKNDFNSTTYLMWAYYLNLKKTFKYIMQKGASRKIIKFNNINGKYYKTEKDILEIIDGKDKSKDKYYINLINKYYK